MYTCERQVERYPPPHDEHVRTWQLSKYTTYEGFVGIVNYSEVKLNDITSPNIIESCTKEEHDNDNNNNVNRVTILMMKIMMVVGWESQKKKCTNFTIPFNFFNSASASKVL